MTIHTICKKKTLFFHIFYFPMEEPFQPYSDSCKKSVFVILYLLLPYGGTISTIFGFSQKECVCYVITSSISLWRNHFNHIRILAKRVCLLFYYIFYFPMEEPFQPHLDSSKKSVFVILLKLYSYCNIFTILRNASIFLNGIKVVI